jgi:hypothetical protein
LFGHLFGDLFALPGLGPGADHRVRGERGADKARPPELGLGAALGAGLIAEAPDAGAGLLDEGNPVQQIAEHGVATNALATYASITDSMGAHQSFAGGKPLGQTHRLSPTPVATHLYRGAPPRGLEGGPAQ